jgi:hypothetical protein
MQDEVRHLSLIIREELDLRIYYLEKNFVCDSG